MKTILLPTDFSANARHAFRFATLLAQAAEARIVLLHVFGLPVSTVQEVPSTVTYQLENEERRATEALDEFRDCLLRETTFPSQRMTTSVRYGFVADAVATTARQFGADYVVMATQGADDVFGKWLGTNTQRVITSPMPCPVWVIPPQAPVQIPRSVLYAADYERTESGATRAVLQFARLFEARMQVVHVHEYYELPVGEITHQLRDEFEADDVTFRTLGRDDVVATLETYLRTHQPDVLALAAYEKGFWESLLHKSVTKHFVQTSQVPVLVVRK